MRSPRTHSAVEGVAAQVSCAGGWSATPVSRGRLVSLTDQLITVSHHTGAIDFQGWHDWRCEWPSRIIAAVNWLWKDCLAA